MKKAFYLLLLLIGFSCQSSHDTLPDNEEENEINTPQEDPEEWIDTDLTRNESEMVNPQNEFAFNLFRQINKEEGHKNIFISPLSAAMALSMTANGAASTTLDEIKTTLGFSSYSQEEMNLFHKKIRRLLLQNEDITSGVANSIWIRKDFPVLDAFKEVNQNYFNAEVQNLDFSNPKSKDIINKWCEEKTNGKIKELLSNINPSHCMFLINTLYFNATWRHPFHEEITTKESFTNQNGTKTTVDMMKMQSHVNYLKNENIHLVELPFGMHRSLSMCILLPQGKNTLQQTINSFNATSWSKWIDQMKENKPTFVHLPKFKVEYDKELQDNLIAMGMKKAFSENIADFSKLSPISTFISKVRQKAFIEINEKGMEVAAGTIVEQDATSTGEEPPTPEEFKVDRPFIYVIKENTNGTILFIGKIEKM